eukprot:316921-Amphidinium_carterae.1
MPSYFICKPKETLLAPKLSKADEECNETDKNSLDIIGSIFSWGQEHSIPLVFEIQFECITCFWPYSRDSNHYNQLFNVTYNYGTMVGSETPPQEEGVRVPAPPRRLGMCNV